MLCVCVCVTPRKTTGKSINKTNVIIKTGCFQFYLQHFTRTDQSTIPQHPMNIDSAYFNPHLQPIVQKPEGLVSGQLEVL